MSLLREEDVRKALKLAVRTHVRVSGIKNLHPQVIAKDLESIKRCGRIEDIIMSMEEIKKRWLGMGIVKSVKYNLEPTSEYDTNDVCVAIDLEESRPAKSVGVFTTDTSLPKVTLSLENVFGGRYSLKGNYIPPASHMHSISLSLLSNVPFIGQTAEYYIGRQTDSKTYHLANAEKVEEIRMTSTNQKPGMQTEVTVGLQKRLLVSKHDESIPDDCRADFSSTQKAYIRHSLHLSSVAYHGNPVLYNMYPLPIQGQQVSAISEFAGGSLGGDCSFAKSEVQATRFWPLGPFFSLQWSAKVAGIYPFFGSRIPLNDRLFLSNYHVRGFKSVGPSTMDIEGAERFAALGGNALWATSVNINFPFLFAPNNGIAAMHVFANAGNLRMINDFEAFRDGYKWLRQCACSIGAGIVVTRIPLFGDCPSGRFELNFCVPLGVDGSGNMVFRNGKRSLFDRFRFGLVWSSSVSS
ncbi:Tob55 [Strigomonas culicis]|uniref:Tob55 n=1 Tax=Strigomonas culicis TaxID=28005 RepID=S9W471_9TRYP|nr:Tob55 [Strigomonas culicis]|eukprot:EPY34131.1 Tob55 [Strigomonas culicis]